MKIITENTHWKWSLGFNYKFRKHTADPQNFKENTNANINLVFLLTSDYEIIWNMLWLIPQVNWICDKTQIFGKKKMFFFCLIFDKYLPWFLVSLLSKNWFEIPGIRSSPSWQLSILNWMRTQLKIWFLAVYFHLEKQKIIYHYYEVLFSGGNWF